MGDLDLTPWDKLCAQQMVKVGSEDYTGPLEIRINERVQTSSAEMVYAVECWLCSALILTVPWFFFLGTRSKYLVTFLFHCIGAHSGEALDLQRDLGF